MLELALVVVSLELVPVPLAFELEPRLPLALPAGVEALAVVDGVELLLDPRLAEVVSGVPCTFT